MIDALEKTKLQVFKRKLKQEKLLSRKDRELSQRVNEIGNRLMGENADSKMTSPGLSSRRSSFEETHESNEVAVASTLQKLSLFVNNRIKHQDFTDADKENMVKLFVTHASTMTYIYNKIFPASKTKLTKRQK